MEEALKHDEDALVAHLDEAEVSVKASAIVQPDDSRTESRIALLDAWEFPDSIAGGKLCPFGKR